MNGGTSRLATSYGRSSKDVPQRFTASARLPERFAQIAAAIEFVEFGACARQMARLRDECGGFLLIMGVKCCEYTVVIGRKRAERGAGAHARISHQRMDRGGLVGPARGAVDL